MNQYVENFISICKELKLSPRKANMLAREVVSKSYQDFDNYTEACERIRSYDKEFQEPELVTFRAEIYRDLGPKAVNTHDPEIAKNRLLAHCLLPDSSIYCSLEFLTTFIKLYLASGLQQDKLAETLSTYR